MPSHPAPAPHPTVGGSRRVGMRRRDYQYGEAHLLTTIGGKDSNSTSTTVAGKAERATRRQSTPPTDASPISSSDEDEEQDENDDERIGRKKTTENEEMKSKSRAAALAEALDEESETVRPTAKQGAGRSSRSVSSSQATAKRSSQEDDKSEPTTTTTANGGGSSSFISIPTSSLGGDNEDDDLWGSSQPAKRRKTGRGYGGGGNRHGYKAIPDSPKKGQKTGRLKGGEFRDPGDGAIEESRRTSETKKGRKDKFRVPKDAPRTRSPGAGFRLPDDFEDDHEKAPTTTAKEDFRMPDEEDTGRNAVPRRKTRSAATKTLDAPMADFKVPDLADEAENLRSAKNTIETLFKAPLEAPENVSSSSLSSNADRVFDVNARRSGSSSPLSSVGSIASARLTQEQKDGLASVIADQEARCPVCHDKVDREFLEEFDNGRKLNFKRQQAFCQAHRIRAAEEQWKDRGYPSIEWTNLDARLQKHFPELEKALWSTAPSFYRNMLEEAVRGGERYFQKKYFDKNQDALSAGYYGPKGARQIADWIASHFSSKLQRLIKTDKLVWRTGASAFVAAVLVPELTVMLVKDDMKLSDDDEARTVLRESNTVGDLLNKEEDDHVERDREEDERFDWDGV